MEIRSRPVSKDCRTSASFKQCLQVAENNRPLTVKQTEIKRRPGLQQEIARPAVSEPSRLVKAEPPAA